MNSVVRPNFEIVFAEKVLAGPVNDARDPLENVGRTIQTYPKKVTYKRINLRHG